MRFNATATALDTTFSTDRRVSIPFDLGTANDTDLSVESISAAGRPVLAGLVVVGADLDFGVVRLANAYIFNDAFECGFSYFWSRTSP